uniref:Uveal autoantigen with coiled-coil domains and ankyrin repeats b n=1 Tax=Neogobius melanostomus TaxID=47308 RepID=A0A8C6UUZ0_9GOBI
MSINVPALSVFMNRIATALTLTAVCVVASWSLLSGRFHLAATRGHLDCLNLILGHGADITATDATGQSSRTYGTFRCFTFTINYNCPVGNVDLQGRTALHDAGEKQTLNECDSSHYLQESLQRSHQEQRGLLDQVSLLQQQLTQVTHTWGLRDLMAFGDDSIVPVASLFTLNCPCSSAHKGSAVLTLGSSAQVQSTSVSRSGAPAAPSELELLRRKQQESEETMARLQAALNRKNRECQDLAQSRDSIQKQADQQIQQLEDALGDVQKRMLESECKVKQLQAHVVAVKEHLGGQANDELRAQLQDVKAKYEGASAEVGRVRNRLKQSEKALEEYKCSESQLAAEAERLNRELGTVNAERDELAGTLLTMESQLKESKAGHTVPAEKFDNMKNLLTNAVDEKERQLAELREDYDRVLEEVSDLHRKVDSPSSQSSEEELKIRAGLEEQNTSLKKRLLEVTAKSQALILEVGLLYKYSLVIEITELTLEVGLLYKYSLVIEITELILEVGLLYKYTEAQVQQLQTEKSTLKDNLHNLQDTKQQHVSQVDELKAQKDHLAEQLELLRRRCSERDEECARLSAQSQALQKSMDGDYVPRRQVERTETELTTTIQRLKAHVSELEAARNKHREELQKVTEGNDKLKGELERVRLEMSRGYVSESEHNAVADGLKKAAVEAENRANRASEMYVSAQEDTRKLTQELEMQKRELDTIQEAIQVKFVPRSALEEKERAYEKQLEELSEKLRETEDKYDEEKTSGECVKREREQLKTQMESAHQRLDLVSTEKQKQLEQEYNGKLRELTAKLQETEEQRDEAKREKAELQQESANSKEQMENLQQRLKSELTRIANYDGELKALNETLRQEQADCKKAREAQQDEAQKVCQVLSSKESLEAEVETLKLALKEEEENNAQRTEDIAALQSELLRATQALEELRHKGENINQLQKDKQGLAEEVSGVREKLLLLSEEVQDAREDAALAREHERKAKTEMSAVQEKGRAIEKEVLEIKERYDQSLNTIRELQKRIQASAQQTEAKDKKITELLTDVERLKQALNGLSQLAYTNPFAHVCLPLFQDAERQHREVVSIYRTHLLSAAQGHMDEDVQAALLQIIRMRQEFVC